MSSIGSSAWIAALDESCRGLPPTSGRAFVAQQAIDGTDLAWFVVADDDGVRVRPGRHPAPDVAIEQDAATAAAIEAGALSAQLAFLDGRLRVSGDVGRLPELAALLLAAA